MAKARVIQSLGFEAVGKAPTPQALARLLNDIAAEGKQAVTLVVPPNVWVLKHSQVPIEVEVPDPEPEPEPEPENSSENVTKRFSLAGGD